MNKLVIADPGKCIGCRTCEIACVMAHAQPGALAQISAAHFMPRLKVVKTTRVSTPVQCRQCEDAPCATVCPTKALMQENNAVQVVQTRCIGCKSCMIACRYGAIEIVPCEVSYVERPAGGSTHVEAYKCDLCAERAGGPACMQMCPTKAIYLIDAAVLAEATRRKREHAAVAQASEGAALGA